MRDESVEIVKRVCVTKFLSSAESLHIFKRVCHVVWANIINTSKLGRLTTCIFFEQVFDKNNNCMWTWKHLFLFHILLILTFSWFYLLKRSILRLTRNEFYWVFLESTGNIEDVLVSSAVRGIQQPNAIPNVLIQSCRSS